MQTSTTSPAARFFGVSLAAAGMMLCAFLCATGAQAATLDDLYKNSGSPSLGRVVLTPGDWVTINTRNAGGANPTFVVNGTTTYTGVAINYGQGEVAVFYFDHLNVPEGVDITVTGTRPLSIQEARARTLFVVRFAGFVVRKGVFATSWWRPGGGME